MRVIGLGAGGHAKVMLEILQDDQSVEIEGLLDSAAQIQGTCVGGVPVLGGDELLDAIRQRGIDHAFIAVGGAADSSRRQQLHERLCSLGWTIITVRHRSAVVSPLATIGTGATLMPLAVVNAHATLGDNVLVNTGAIVEHDCVIGSHVHVATGARLGGGVIVGSAAHIGIGATVRELVKIGDGAVVGAGAVVIRDVEAGDVVVGVPAHPITRRVHKAR